MRPLLPLSIATAIAISISSAYADTTPAFAPSADTCLFEFLPDFNWGKEPELVAGVLGSMGDSKRCRILMEFDIAANVPAGSTITAAQLTMTATKAPGGATNGNFQLLRVLVPWEEGNKDGPDNPGGATATAGETTWDERLMGSANWTSPGGKLEVDFAEDASAAGVVSGVPSASGQVNIFPFNSTGTDDLQSMLAFPDFNYGWVFLVQNESAMLSARRWASADHPSAAPQLVVTFTPPAPPPTPVVVSSNLDSATGLLSVQVEAIAGTTYTLETSSNPGGAWSPVDSQSALSDGLITLSTTPAAGTKRLFFRVSAIFTP